jgi:acetyl esterase/lipase
LERSNATPFRAAALLYGVYDWTLMQRLPRGVPFASFDSTARDVGHYLSGDESLFTRPSVSPASSPDLALFPQTQLIIGTEDPLRMQSEVFAADLQRAGVAVDLRVYQNVPHAFMQIEELPETLIAQADLFSFLHQALGAD